MLHIVNIGETSSQGKTQTVQHDTLDDNIEVVGFYNEEGGDVCVQDDLNDNVSDAVEKSSSGLEFKKRKICQ